MNKVAKDVFFSEAYQRNEQEREHWQREVLGELLMLRLEQGIDTLGNQTLNDISQEAVVNMQLYFSTSVSVRSI